MGLELEYGDRQTPLSDEEKDGLLIKIITTHGELDEHEQLNIEKAIEWTIKTKFKKDQILSQEFIKTLHKKMLGDVWARAGKFRKSEKNIGVQWITIGVELQTLIDDAKYWIVHDSYSPEETALRFKHRLVKIHCFPNGNGRHSRIMADIIMESIFKSEPFSWNHSNMVRPDQTRRNYIDAIREGDRGNIQPLIDFAKN
ncbi:MAG: mobile mystery protein B [Cytophagaceae bacterium]|nr:mobile mystery protein B [Cytophagaceae bacterium]